MTHMKDHIALNTGRATAEIEARTELVRFLASQPGSTNSIFAAEVVYGFENRRADFLKLDTQSHAFEIKSDYDNTSRLSGQLAEYSKTFDFVTIVTTPKHLREVREMPGKSTDTSIMPTVPASMNASQPPSIMDFRAMCISSRPCSPRSWGEKLIDSRAAHLLAWRYCIKG